RRKGCGQALQPSTFSFAANEQEPEIGRVDQVLQKISPFCFRPIFSLAAAAGMECDLVQGGNLPGQSQARNWIGLEDGKALERFEKSLAGVERFRFVWPMGSCQELGAGAPADVGLRNSIRIVQVRNDEVELGKVIDQI